MNSYTGEYRPLDSAYLLEDNEVFVQGSLEQIEELSRSVRLGNAELERRNKRRKLQKKSRKKNR